MRNVYTAELARLRYTVVNCRTGALVAAFTDCADACALRDAGPRNRQGEPLYVVGEQEPKVTKPRLRSRRRTERALPLRELFAAEPEPRDHFNFFARSL